MDAETATLSVIEASGVTNLVPGAQETDEDIALIFSTGNGNSISVDDGSPAAPLLRTSLSVTNGILTLATTASLTFETGADASSAMTISGPESAINAALNGLNYTPADHYNGPENLQVTSDALEGLIAQYTFDNPPDPGHDDSPDGGHNGTINGGTTPIFDLGRNSYVLPFDGNDDHVLIRGRLGEPQNVTLAAWVNLNSGLDSLRDELISIGDSVSIRLDETAQGVVGFYHHGANFNVTSSFTPIAGTGWHHIAYTIDTVNHTQVLYIDGVPGGSSSYPDAIDYRRGTDTYIGRNGFFTNDSQYFLHGSVDDVRIYDRALSAVEVTSLFAVDLSDGGGSDTDDIAITINPVNDAPVLTASMPTLTPIHEDDVTNPGDLVSSLLGNSVSDADAGDAEGIAITSASNANGIWAYTTDGSTWSPVGVVSNSNARLLLANPNTRLRFEPHPDAYGTVSPGIAFRAWDHSTGIHGGTADTTNNGGSTAFSTGTDTANIVVTAVADTPQVAPVTTPEDTQSAPIVIARHVNDGNEVTYFKITGITGGTLFQNDGITPINNDAFITFAQGQAGLKFLPSPESIANGSFSVQASLSSDATGIGGGIANATITVTPVADTPSVTDAATLEDHPTSAGLVISRNPVDGPEVTHFKITVISGGTLYQNDGITPVNNGQFITFAQGQAGLRFSPTANSEINGSFTIQASTLDNNTGLGGGTVNATITVTPVADTPSVTNASTLEDHQTLSGLVISRHISDGIAVTHFKITAISGGTLYQNDGTTPINNNQFITFTQGQAGLRFTPAANTNANGSFTLQASTLSNNAGLGGNPVHATITVTPIGDTPQVMDITTDEDTQSGPITIDRHSADGPEVTHFRISNITNGALYHHDGITPIHHDSYITVSQGQAGLRFTPAQDSTAPGHFDVESSEDGLHIAAQSDVATATITVTPVNDDPIVTLPASSVTYSEGDPPTVINATATVRAPDVAHFDTGVLTIDIIAGATANDRLAIRDQGAGSGHISLSGSDIRFDFGAGPVGIGTFSGGAAMPLIINLNANADANAVQALLRNITYANIATIPSQANRVIEFVINDGDDGTSSPVTQTIVFNVLSVLWLNAQDNTNPSDTNLPAWLHGDVVKFGTRATFGEATTSGLFTQLFALLLDDASQANLNAMHYVTRPITLGDGANTFAVHPGDLIATLSSGGTLQSTNSLAVSPKDVFVFQPDTPGDYTSGTFSMLLEDPVGADIQAISLVEENVAFDDGTSLIAGTLLLAHAGDHENIFTFQASGVGPAPATAGTQQLFLDGSVLGFSEPVQGLKLLEDDVTIGDTTIPATRLLISIAGDTTVAGQTVTGQDIVTLHVTATEQGAGTAATAAILFDGDRVNLSDATETFDGLTIARSNPLMANTPSVTHANTLEDHQTTSGLVISRHPSDGSEVTHFQITDITGGTLYENDGTTPINNGQFITFAQSNVGLKFTPLPNSTANGRITVQASTAPNKSGLGGETVDATITVTPVGDTPSITSTSTFEDNPTNAGLVISRHVADGTEVTHFKITDITGGFLYQNDGITAINHGDFITFAQGQAGLKFVPIPNRITPGSFDVEASEDGSNVAAQSDVATATITITPVADTPSITDATTLKNHQTTSGLVISRNPVDGPEVTHFKITAISGGTLYQNDGITPINDGQFITFAQGHAGLRFTPTANANASGNFTVQASIANHDIGLGGATVDATITVTNADPAAHAGGPYAIDEGSTVTLDASLTTDRDSASLTYAWDLNGDNRFDDAAGVAPQLSWAQLQSLGINDGDQSYPIKLRVQDDEGGRNEAVATRRSQRFMSPTSHPL